MNAEQIIKEGLIGKRIELDLFSFRKTKGSDPSYYLESNPSPLTLETIKGTRTEYHGKRWMLVTDVQISGRRILVDCKSLVEGWTEEYSLFIGLQEDIKIENYAEE
jgi:hypothetical protein